jgi:acetyl esterase/lipase
MTYALDPELVPAMAALAEGSAAAPARPRGDWRTLRESGNAGQAAMAAMLPPSPEVHTTTYYATAPDGVEIEMRWYPGPGPAEAGPAVVYAHGGGMVLGNLDAYDTLLSWYVARSGVPFLSVGYRLAPESTGTALAEDVYCGLTWLIGRSAGLGVDPARIAVMGDSGPADPDLSDAG